MNCLVGPLFEGQADVQPEAVVPAGTFLGRTHDAVTPARDDHEPVLDRLVAHFFGHLEFRGVRREPRGAEDRHFAPVGIRLENLGGVTQFLQRLDDELDVGHRGFVPTEQQRCLDQLFK